MATLLENGNIRRLAPVQTDDGRLSGDIVIEISPSEPRYGKLYAEAQRSLAVK